MPTTTQWFSPNGDGIRDTVSLTATNSEAAPSSHVSSTATARTVRWWTDRQRHGPVALTWDGRNSAGAYVPDGVYTVRVAPRDMAGNTGPPLDRTVDVIGGTAIGRDLEGRCFFPQDLDSCRARPCCHSSSPGR